MKDDDGATFLGRWSRRKSAARAGKPLEEPQPAPGPRAAEGSAPGANPADGAPGASREQRAPPNPAPPDVPDLDSLRGLESEYRDFLRPGVDDGTRRAALKKLFADPHFNRMDGLDVYIDDYSLPDPVPAAMLRGLAHAKDLLFRDEPPQEGEAAPGAEAGAPPRATAPQDGDIALQQDPVHARMEGGSQDQGRGTPGADPNCPDSIQPTRKPPDAAGS